MILQALGFQYVRPFLTVYSDFILLSFFICHRPHGPKHSDKRGEGDGSQLQHTPDDCIKSPQELSFAFPKDASTPLSQPVAGQLLMLVLLFFIIFYLSS